MVRKGKLVRSRTDYILGTYRRIFWNVYVRDPRHNSDHYMVLSSLRSPPQEGTRQIPHRAQAAAPRPPAEPMREDRIFAARRRAVLKPHARERRKNGWILEDTWRLVDKRISARRKTRD